MCVLKIPSIHLHGAVRFVFLSPAAHAPNGKDPKLVCDFVCCIIDNELLY